FANNQMPAKDITLFAQFSKDAASGGDSGGTDEGGGNSENSTDGTTNTDTINHIVLPATGDDRVLFPIFIGTVLTGLALLTLRRK
ncbi:cell surface protein, partial [Listeria innocua FSL J1-023]